MIIKPKNNGLGRCSFSLLKLFAFLHSLFVNLKASFFFLLCRRQIKIRSNAIKCGLEDQCTQMQSLRAGLHLRLCLKMVSRMTQAPRRKQDQTESRAWLNSAFLLLSPTASSSATTTTAIRLVVWLLRVSPILLSIWIQWLYFIKASLRNLFIRFLSFS